MARKTFKCDSCQLRRAGFDLTVIKAAIEVLKHLNPRPGSQFTADNIPYVVPDIVVERREDGEYDVRLLDDWSPRRTEFSLFYSSRRHLPVKLRALVEFLRRESKEAAHVDESRPVCLAVIAAADRRRSDQLPGGEQRNADDLPRRGEVIPIRRRVPPLPSDNALAMVPGG